MLQNLLQPHAALLQFMDAALVFFIDELLVGKGKALVREPAPVHPAPYGLSRIPTVVPQQEALQRVLRRDKILFRLPARPHHVADRLMRLVRHPDGGEFTGAQQPGQRLRIAAVGFYTIIRPTRHGGRRDHDAVDPEALQKTIDHEPAWAGLVADLQRRAVVPDARERLAQHLAVIGDGPKEPDFTISNVVGDGNPDELW